MQAEIRNHTPLAEAVVPLTDEHGTPVLVPLLQASFDIAGDGTLALPDEVPPLALGGIAWDDDPAQGWRVEPQMAFVKPGCDVVLNGHALATARGCTRMAVEFTLGAAQRRALVFGERHLLEGRRVSGPQPFERVPLRWTQAFGGRDTRHADAAEHREEPRNPVGLGFRDPRQPVDADVRLPALEDPQLPYARYGDTPPPVGFGFVAPQWQPRTAWAGTYDDAWQATRMPLLPRDFDRRFFCAAASGLALAQPPAGGERASVVGTTPAGRLDFTLPALGTPLFHAHLRGRRRTTLKLVLDTVIVDTDRMQLQMIWRAHLPLRNGPHDLVAGEFHLPDVQARATLRAARAAQAAQAARAAAAEAGR